MRPPVITRYLLKETGLTSLAVAVVLLGVLFTNALVRLLGQAAENDIPSGGVLSLVGLATIGYFRFLLPASILLGIVLAFGRLYRDSEMPALAACGVGPGRLFRALLTLAIPATVLVAWLSLSVAPWAARAATDLQAALVRSMELESISAGRFLTSKRAQGMLYVESMGPDGEMRDVFLETRRDDQTIVVTAASGRRRVDPGTGESFLVLSDGWRVEGIPGDLRWRILQFEEHGVRLSEGPSPDVYLRLRAVPTAQLLERRGIPELAELQDRLAPPLMMLVLTLLAVPLSRTAPRAGRYGKLMVAVLAFVVYVTLLNASVELLKEGKLPPEVGVWWVHGLMVALALLWWRHSFGVWRPLRRRRR